MDVVAYLPRQLLSHLTIVLGSQHTLIPAEGWDELRVVVLQHASDLLVVDPLAEGNPRTDVVLEIRREFPSIPIVVYTTLTADSMRAILELGRAGIEHVVLNRFDDERRRFLEMLERVPSHGLSDDILRQLAAELNRLPVPLARAIEQMFRSPSQLRTTLDLARSAGTILRTLYRHLDAAGFRSPRLLLAAARLLRVYSQLRDPGRQIKDVAVRAGYSSQYQLTQHMRALTGHTPRTVRNYIEPEQFVSLLAEGIRGSRQSKRIRERSSS